MKTRRWILVAVVLVLLAGCSTEPTQIDPTATPVPDEALDPSSQPVRSGVTILADGIVQAVQPVLPLAFETGGKLLAVHVQAGEQVPGGSGCDARSIPDQHREGDEQLDAKEQDEGFHATAQPEVE